MAKMLVSKLEFELRGCNHNAPTSGLEADPRESMETHRPTTRKQ